MRLLLLLCPMCEILTAHADMPEKILKVIQKETSSLKRASPSEITDARWKSLEEAMSQYVFP